MDNISIISFDGLHNNGKTTQIKLLKEKLRLNNISVLIRRGDGMRKGEGSEVNDPESTWWRENISRLRATGFEGPDSMAAASESANRLNAELYVAKNYFMPKIIQKEGTSSGVILLDRGPISRLFVKRRENPEATFETISTFANLTGIHNVLIPDKIFLLHAPLEVLISRNSDRDSEKSKFNETVLTKYYGDFENVINDLPKELRTRTVRIDSTLPIDNIHSIVFESAQEIITRNSNTEGSFVRIEGR